MDETIMDWAAKYDDEQWSQALCGGDPRAPVMPAVDLQARFVGSSGTKAFKETAAFWRIVKSAMAEAGAPMTPTTRVLDIGVGWGRLYRWALRDLPRSQITGIDVDPRMISLCAAAMPYGDFRRIEPGNSYPLERESIDFAFAYSVFSHLSEETARFALACAHDVMKPGGILAATTLRLAHIEVWHSQLDDPAYGPCLARSGFDRIEWWELAADGKHLFVPTGGGDPSRPPEAYGLAAVPKGWWQSVDGFRLIDFSRPVGLPQALVILQRI